MHVRTDDLRMEDEPFLLSGRLHEDISEVEYGRKETVDRTGHVLDPVETERFGGILTRIVAERDVAILLVEHDMSLVNRLCDHVYVIDFGKHCDLAVAEPR